MPLSALGGENFSVQGQLVGWRYLRLLQRHLLDSNVQAVFAFGASSVVAIEENFCANIRQAVRKKAGLSIAAEDGVEGLNVRIDCELESRIGGMVGWRIAEQILTTQGVELVVPFRAGSRRRHDVEWITASSLNGYSCLKVNIRSRGGLMEYDVLILAHRDRRLLFARSGK